MDPADVSSLKIDKSAPSFSRRRRLPSWAVLLLLALVVGAGGFWFLSRRPTAVTVATVSAVYPSQTFTVLNASGYVVAQRKAAVSSKVTGRLVWLGVEEGSRVRAGQVLARLESDDVAAVRGQSDAALSAARAAVDQAAASLAQGRAAVDEARANLEQARAEEADADRELQRQRDLLAVGVTTQAVYDAAGTRTRRARAAVASARAATAVAEHGLDGSSSSLLRARAAATGAQAAVRGAAVNVGYTLLRAPFDAVVLTKNADIGDVVTPIGSAASAKAAVVTLADLGSLLVEADVSESNLGKIRVGQPAEIQLDALPDERFPAVLHTIVPTADRSKGTVMTKVRFTRLDPRILPEMSAKVAFLLRAVGAGEQTPRMAVVPGAVVDRGGRRVAFVVRDGRAVETAVLLGPALGDQVEIRHGLAAGDKVVVAPPPSLRTGSPVKPREE